MIETFLFVRLGEGEVCKNVIWKLQKCYEPVLCLLLLLKISDVSQCFNVNVNVNVNQIFI